MRYQVILESKADPGHVLVVTTLSAPLWCQSGRDMDICVCGNVEIDGVYGTRFDEDEDIEHNDFNGLLDEYFKDSLYLSMDQYGVSIGGMSSDWNTYVKIITISARLINDDGTCDIHPELNHNECPCAGHVKRYALGTATKQVNYTHRNRATSTLVFNGNGYWMPVDAGFKPFTVEELLRSGLVTPDTGFETPEQYENAMAAAGWPVKRDG